jgi:hypothetical protein
VFKVGFNSPRPCPVIVSGVSGFSFWASDVPRNAASTFKLFHHRTATATLIREKKREKKEIEHSFFGA